MTRRQFDPAGHIKETHVKYSALTTAAAQEGKVPLVDLDKLSWALLQQYGPKASKLLFMQLAPGYHLNYPLGRNDNTHFSETGARKIPLLVVSDLRAQHVPLFEQHLAKALPKNPVAVPTGATA